MSIYECVYVKITPNVKHPKQPVDDLSRMDQASGAPRSMILQNLPILILQLRTATATGYAQYRTCD